MGQVRYHVKSSYHSYSSPTFISNISFGLKLSYIIRYGGRRQKSLQSLRSCSGFWSLQATVTSWTNRYPDFWPRLPITLSQLGAIHVWIPKATISQIVAVHLSTLRDYPAGRDSYITRATYEAATNRVRSRVKLAQALK